MKLVAEPTEDAIVGKIDDLRLSDGATAAVFWRVESGSPRGHLSVAALSHADLSKVVRDASDRFWLVYHGAPGGDLDQQERWTGWVEVRSASGALMERADLSSRSHPPSSRVREYWQLSARAFDPPRLPAGLTARDLVRERLRLFTDAGRDLTPAEQGEHEALNWVLSIMPLDVGTPRG